MGQRSVVNWVSTVVLNAALGYLGVIPLVLLFNALGHAVGGWLGLGTPATRFTDEGESFVVGLYVVTALGLAAMFWTLNHWISRLTRLRGPVFWWTALAVAALPTVIAMIAPEVRSAFNWF